MHERFEAALGDGARRPGRHATRCTSTAQDVEGSRRARRAARSTSICRSATFALADARACRMRRCARRTRHSRRGARRRWPNESRLLRRVADSHRGSASTRSPPRWRSRSARTAWRRSAKRRRRSTSSATTADDFESHGGFEHELPNDPLPDVVSRNRSVMRPYGVWVGDRAVQLSARAGGRPGGGGARHRQHGRAEGRERTRPGPAGCWPTACATPACRPASSTISRDPGADVGDALVAHPLLRGLTFTGSVAVGMGLLRQMAGGAYPRPCIAEMGGKNACIVTAARRSRPRRGRASCARPTAWAGRNARRCRGCTSTQDVADALVERLEA